MANSRPNDPFTKLSELGTDQQLFVGKFAQAQPRKVARKPALVPTTTGVRTHAPIYERVRKAVINRSRLGGFTFRYRTEELDRLDALVAKINKDQQRKVSKNDVVRMGLNWLLEDFDEHKDTSVLAQILRRLRE